MANKENSNVFQEDDLGDNECDSDSLTDLANNTEDDELSDLWDESVSPSCFKSVNVNGSGAMNVQSDFKKENSGLLEDCKHEVCSSNSDSTPNHTECNSNSSSAHFSKSLVFPSPQQGHSVQRSYKQRPLNKLFSDNHETASISGDAFCRCYKGTHRRMKSHQCTCGEDDEDFDWVWDENAKSWACYLQRGQREVKFHKHYSSGTATIRGNTPLSTGQHYWEIKMISPVYGTDMMIGIGTAEADLNRNSRIFCSFLGSDSETWGLSYTGIFHHNGKSKCYSPRFGQGAIIGVHLDTWKGTLSFYKNQKLLGIACDGLKGKVLYPMVSSTAARSGMRMVKSCSFTSSLKFFSCLTLRNNISRQLSVLDCLPLPPGLEVYLQNNLSWLLGTRMSNSKKICCGDCDNGCSDGCQKLKKAELFLENQLKATEFSISDDELLPKTSMATVCSSTGTSRKQPIDFQDDFLYHIAKRRCTYHDSGSSNESDSD